MTPAETADLYTSVMGRLEQITRRAEELESRSDDDARPLVAELVALSTDASDVSLGVVEDYKRACMELGERFAPDFLAAHGRMAEAFARATAHVERITRRRPRQ